MILVKTTLIISYVVSDPLERKNKLSVSEYDVAALIQTRRREDIGDHENITDHSYSWHGTAERFLTSQSRLKWRRQLATPNIFFLGPTDQLAMFAISTAEFLLLSAILVRIQISKKKFFENLQYTLTAVLLLVVNSKCSSQAILFCLGRRSSISRKWPRDGCLYSSPHLLTSLPVETNSRSEDSRGNSFRNRQRPYIADSETGYPPFRKLVAEVFAHGKCSSPKDGLFEC